MIKLTRAAKPAYLTTEKINQLTNDFLKSGKSVWNNEHIKSTLLASSNSKCAYCECPLDKDSNYMEVEHFADKKNNPNLVVEWDNLLPACKRCNGAKANHDVNVIPILNPYLDDPKDHLALRLYRLRGKTEKGRSTIDVTNLNHSTRLVVSRYEIGNKIGEMIDLAWEKLSTFQTTRGIRERNRLTGMIEGMLRECLPSAPYCASTATSLITDQRFSDLVNAMKADAIWDAELNDLMAAASNYVLDVV